MPTYNGTTCLERLTPHTRLLQRCN